MHAIPSLCRIVRKIVSHPRLLRFASDQRGVTAIEYGILAAGLAVVIATAVSSDGAFAKAINDIFGRIAANLPRSK